MKAETNDENEVQIYENKNLHVSDVHQFVNLFTEYNLLFD